MYQHVTSLGRRSILRAAAAASMVPAPFLAGAQPRFPAHALSMVVPLPVGTAADLSARILADALGAALGQTVSVDNKPGEAFNVAVQALASAPADGYTLLHINPVMCAVQAVQKNFDLTKLVPIGQMGATDMLILASANAPFKTLPEMLEWAEARPGKLVYGTLGQGSLEHLTMVALLRRSNITANSVAYKGGADGAQALARGEVQVMPLAAPFYVKFKDSLVALAVNQRDAHSGLAPSVPTLRELNVNIPSASYWGGLAAAPGTPPQVASQLEQAMAAAVNAPELRKRFMQLGMVPRFESAQDLRLRIAVDLAWMSGIAQSLQKAA